MASQPNDQPASNVKQRNTLANEEVNVLITAFDTFDGFTEHNPAWQIAISLPPALKVDAAHPSRIRIVVHPVPVSVSYEAIENFVDETYRGGEQFKYQLVIHLAVSPENKSYKLERRARRTGYTKSDVSNKVPSKNATNALKGSPLALDTPARLQDVYKRWKGQLPNTTVEISDDAGLFLAEYLYYESLSKLYRQSNRALIWEKRTTITLVQIPPLKDAKELEEGREVVSALIYALIDSRRQRNGDFDTEEVGPESQN